MHQKISIFFLRISMGWFFLYSGYTKIINPAWSAAGYIDNAKTFAPFFHLLATPSLIHIVTLLNEWGQLLLGISLIVGLFVRYSAIAGAVLMVLYWLPILTFPYVAGTPVSYIVDEHIIFAAALLVLAAVGAGKTWGLDAKFGR